MPSDPWFDPRYDLPHEKDGQPLLVEGMLLLGGLRGVDGEPLNYVWTVYRIGKRSARITCFTGGITADATLRSPYLPPGWRILDNRAVATAVQAGATTPADPEAAT